MEKLANYSIFIYFSLYLFGWWDFRVGGLRRLGKSSPLSKFRPSPSGLTISSRLGYSVRDLSVPIYGKEISGPDRLGGGSFGSDPCQNRFLLLGRVQRSLYISTTNCRSWNPYPTYFSPTLTPIQLPPGPLPGFRRGWENDLNPG